MHACMVQRAVLQANLAEPCPRPAQHCTAGMGLGRQGARESCWLKQRLLPVDTGHVPSEGQRLKHPSRVKALVSLACRMARVTLLGMGPGQNAG